MQNVKSKVQYTHSISRICVALEFGLVTFLVLLDQNKIVSFWWGEGIKSFSRQFPRLGFKAASPQEE